MIDGQENDGETNHDMVQKQVSRLLSFPRLQYSIDVAEQSAVSVWFHMLRF